MRETFGPSSTNQNETFHFGTGRKYMKKLYVDEIFNKGGATPGPSKYFQPRYFGSPDKSKYYSIAKRLPNDDLSL